MSVLPCVSRAHSCHFLPISLERLGLDFPCLRCDQKVATKTSLRLGLVCRALQRPAPALQRPRSSPCHRLSRFRMLGGATAAAQAKLHVNRMHRQMRRSYSLRDYFFRCCCCCGCLPMKKFARQTKQGKAPGLDVPPRCPNPGQQPRKSQHGVVGMRASLRWCLASGVGARCATRNGRGAGRRHRNLHALTPSAHRRTQNFQLSCCCCYSYHQDCALMKPLPTLLVLALALTQPFPGASTSNRSSKFGRQILPSSPQALAAFRGDGLKIWRYRARARRQHPLWG